MKNRTSRKSTLDILLSLSVIALTIGLLLGGCSSLPTPTAQPSEATEGATPAPTETEEVSPTETPEPTAQATVEPAASPTLEPSPTAASLQTALRAIDGMEMVLIPEGSFLMGDDESAFATEKPAHEVTLDAYWIDRYEVTNAQFRACVEAGICAEPRMWSNPDLSGPDQPALVPWESAQVYCEWVTATLPSEAQWEKAIRGIDGRTWPWGDEFVADRANLSGESDGYGATSPVGSFPEDVSPYGLYDAAGNAAEWVADWWAADYYLTSPASNPAGPPTGSERVHRAPIANAGGGPEKCRCTARYGVDPNWDYGFRCVTVTLPVGE